MNFYKGKTTMKFTKLLAIMSALVMCVCMFAACDKSNAEDDGSVIKLGLTGPLKGPCANYGKAVAYGAEIAVEEINAKGGVRFAFKYSDDEGDDEKAVKAYNRLIDWGMDILVGTVTSDACIAVSAETYIDRVFTLTPSASSADVTANKDNIFRVCLDDLSQGASAARYIAENYPDARVAVIYRDDDAYSEGIRNAFCTEAAAQGLAVVYESTFTENTQTNFSLQLRGAKSIDADLVFLPIYYQPASAIINQANQMGYAPTFFGVDGMDGILAADNFDAALAEGVLFLTSFSADAEDELTKSFVAKYKEKHGEIPNQFAADGYDAVYILAQAVEEAGITADMTKEEMCERLIAVMPTVSYTGLTGQGLTWNGDGQVSKESFAVVIKDGVYVTP